MVLETIFSTSLPALEPKLYPCPSPMTVNALLEIVTLLQALLVALSPSTVRKQYVERRPIPVQNLLLILPLPDLATAAQADGDTREAQQSAVLRRQILHIEVARLVASVASVIGSNGTTEYILPSVNMYVPHPLGRRHSSGDVNSRLWPLCSFRWR